MKKPAAIALAQEQYNVVLNSGNAHFSNVNSAKPVWWFQIPIKKIENNSNEEIYLIANQQGSISLFKVPTKYILANLRRFKIRGRKQFICIELCTETFKNTVGPAQDSFRRFLIKLP